MERVNDLDLKFEVKTQVGLLPVEASFVRRPGGVTKVQVTIELFGQKLRKSAYAQTSEADLQRYDFFVGARIAFDRLITEAENSCKDQGPHDCPNAAIRRQVQLRLALAANDRKFAEGIESLDALEASYRLLTDELANEPANAVVSTARSRYRAAYGQPASEPRLAKPESYKSVNASEPISEFPTEQEAEALLLSLETAGAGEPVALRTDLSDEVKAKHAKVREAAKQAILTEPGAYQKAKDSLPEMEALGRLKAALEKALGGKPATPAEIAEVKASDAFNEARGIEREHVGENGLTPGSPAGVLFTIPIKVNGNAVAFHPVPGVEGTIQVITEDIDGKATVDGRYLHAFITVPEEHADDAVVPEVDRLTINGVPRLNRTDIFPAKG